VYVAHLCYNIIQYSFLTQIPHPLHLYHNYFYYHPALPLAFAQPHSAVCSLLSAFAAKSNPRPLLMSCDIALIAFSSAAAAAKCGKQAVDTPLLLCQLFNLNRKL